MNVIINVVNLPGGGFSVRVEKATRVRKVAATKCLKTFLAKKILIDGHGEEDSSSLDQAFYFAVDWARKRGYTVTL